VELGDWRIIMPRREEQLDKDLLAARQRLIEELKDLRRSLQG
jgi:hypothetical protein